MSEKMTLPEYVVPGGEDGNHFKHWVQQWCRMKLSNAVADRQTNFVELAKLFLNLGKKNKLDYFITHRPEEMSLVKLLNSRTMTVDKVKEKLRELQIL